MHLNSQIHVRFTSFIYLLYITLKTTCVHATFKEYENDVFLVILTPLVFHKNLHVYFRLLHSLKSRAVGVPPLNHVQWTSDEIMETGGLTFLIAESLRTEVQSKGTV